MFRETEYADKEIRHLGAGGMFTLINILNVEDDWKKFMCFIPKDLQNGNKGPKYNSEDIRKLEEYAKATKEPYCAKIMFEEWGTSGETRPTLRTVQQIALKAKMMRLADEISRILGEPLCPRPTQGPGAPVTTQLTQILHEQNSDKSTQVGSEDIGVNEQESTKQVHNVPNWELLKDSNGLNHTQSPTQGPAASITMQVTQSINEENLSTQLRESDTMKDQAGSVKQAHDVPNWDLFENCNGLNHAQSTEQVYNVR